MGTVQKKDLSFLREMREREPQITDETSLPPVKIKELIRLIRKGAKDLKQKWKDAVHLTNKAYDVANIDLPHMTEIGAWNQYQSLIGISVRELAKARGALGKDSDWRITKPKYLPKQSAIPGKGIS